ncbi:Hypothetical predicted protein [Olea europaea subsp. europaea]|uniref:Uncharacterized protein n=1 Tax=Olea europaea subsp. europaea TaxID=158383 RepID=A0A8S0PVQ0_OLEEU|nr:Hypothetical predicted protein [Olea europaea subsp. europaea]
MLYPAFSLESMGGFFQNSNCKCLLSDIFSIYLIGRPLVSGTHTGTNNNATTEITPNIRNVHDVPIACVKDRKDCATIRFDIQLAVAAMPPQMPQYLREYISELTNHGTVPVPGEKNMI